jgi:hypothetical protein
MAARVDSLLKTMKMKEKDVFARGHSLSCQYGSGNFDKNGHNNIKKVIKASMDFFGNFKEAFYFLDEEETQLAKRLEGIA